MTRTRGYRPVVLCILDGWGEGQDGPDNAVRRARTPVWRHLKDTCPHTRLQASEGHVGLPVGQMGNSEVGHMNIGSGRVILQDLPRIDQALADGTLAGHATLARFVARLRESGGRCHLIGLVSPGGVHSHQRHLAALARHVTEAGVDVAIHAVLDGRDTPPSEAAAYVARFAADIADRPRARIATVSGRYYAMDRDQRWERTAQAYATIALGRGPRFDSADAAISDAYARGVTDEFVLPACIGSYDGMRDGDGVICGNFRADRVRQILGALLDPDFDGFARARAVGLVAALGLTSYSDRLSALMATLFPAETPRSVLGEVVAAAGRTQLRIAETEKYAHVTFFLNGGEERQFAGEERILVPSPKVATYDLQPEMSAPEVTARLVDAIDQGRFDLIVVNYANPDMVGHTGNLDAAIRAVETVDACLGRIAEAVTRAAGVLLITADHGNVEKMRDPESGQPHTAHTLAPVPAVLVGASAIAGLGEGSLADVAPTVLALMGLEVPAAMSGHSLLITASERKDARAHAST